MQLIARELTRAKERLAEATDPRAHATLEGVVMALEWAFEDGGRASPSELAAGLTTDPLDHDGDGHKGGSVKRKRK
jgi:hypothetical protein